jgi:AcrR family transcriptional regulator
VTQGRVVARRPLRSDSIATRQRIIDAAVELARTGPVASITMRDIARSAGVSTATAYTYFASKEHVYAEAYIDGINLLTESVRTRPPRGDTAAARVAAVFRRAVRGAGAMGEVVQASAIALASSDPAVTPLRPAADEAFAEWVALALAGARIVGPEQTIRLLQLTMFGAFVAVAHDRLSLADAATLLDTAAQRLVLEE